MEIISFFILGLGGLYDKYVSTQDLQNFVFDYENDNYKKAFLLSCQNTLKKNFIIYSFCMNRISIMMLLTSSN